jgi:hypothetical protein
MPGGSFMILAELPVLNGTREDFDLFDISVSSAIEELSGPPEGLMSHVVRPDGDGFLICDVWRTSEDLRRFNDGILRPLLEAAGLESGAERVSAVWSFARP